MKYNIGKSKVPEISGIGKGQNASNSCSFRPQKACLNLVFDAFPYSWCTGGRCGISAFRPHLEGIVWSNDPSGGKKWG